MMMEWSGESGELTMSAIHQSIEKNMDEVKRQLEEVRRCGCDVGQLKSFVSEVLKPHTDSLRYCSVSTLERLRVLVRSYDEERLPILPPLPLNPIASSSSSTTPDSNNHKKRVLRYPQLTRPSHLKPRPPRHAPSSSSSSANHRTRHEQIKLFADDTLAHVISLRRCLVRVTQKILLPLQTFCKPEAASATAAKPTSSTSAQVDHLELVIVEGLNRAKELLWPATASPHDHISDDAFTKTGVSQEISEQVDCRRFGVVRIVPDVVCKLARILEDAAVWLRHDLWYTHGAKTALCRAHRRCLKTERLWQQACQVHERLTVEWNEATEKLESTTSRLRLLHNKIASLKEDMERVEDQERTLRKMIDAETRREGTKEGQSTKKGEEEEEEGENPDHLTTRQLAITKRLRLMQDKLEGRERSCRLLHSRSNMLHGSRDSLANKLAMSEGEVEMLRAKLTEMRLVRAAWHRRYRERSNPELLQQRYESAKLTVPLPAVREKTFILKTRAEHLKEATELVRDKLTPRKWEQLCRHLRWSGTFAGTLPDIADATCGAKKAATRHHHRDDDASSTSSNSASSAAQGGAEVRWLKVANYVRARFPYAGMRDGNLVERDRLALLLKLWVIHNGRQATVDKLLLALGRAKNSSPLTTAVGIVQVK